MLYARFSPRPNAAECESCERQLEDLRAWCFNNNYQIASEHRDEALREFRGGAGRATDCTFPEHFWDGRLFLDGDELADRGISRQTLASFARDAYVEDDILECDVHLIRNGRERIIVVDWPWKEDDVALDAWLAFKV